VAVAENVLAGDLGDPVSGLGQVRAHAGGQGEAPAVEGGVAHDSVFVEHDPGELPELQAAQLAEPVVLGLENPFAVGESPPGLAVADRGGPRVWGSVEDRPWPARSWRGNA
jgi:hypothetical protein